MEKLVEQFSSQPAKQEPRMNEGFLRQLLLHRVLRNPNFEQELAPSCDFSKFIKPLQFCNLFASCEATGTPLKIEQYSPLFWKLNILASHKNHLFMANGKHVECFAMNFHVPATFRSNNFSPTTQLDKQLKYHTSNTIQFVHKWTCTDEINQLTLGTVCNEQVVVAICNTGTISLFYLADFNRKPIILESDGESAWSLSVSGKLCAIGSNAHKITVWDLSSLQKFEICGHNHNIPCIKFSPCGRYLASASIDCNVRIWNIQEYCQHLKQKQEQPAEITMHKPYVMSKPNREWGWSVAWVNKQSVKIVTSEEFWNQARLFCNSTLLGNGDEDHESVDSIPGGDGEHEEEGMEYETDEDEEIGIMTHYEDAQRTEEVHQHLDQLQDSAPPLQQQQEQQAIELKPNDLDLTDLLLYGSKHHLFLLESKSLRVLSSLYFNPARCVRFLPHWMQGLSRLSLLEYIPELSVALVASQIDSKVLIVRIVANTDYTNFQLVPEKLIPETDDVYPVCGLSVQRIDAPWSPLIVSFRVYVMTVNKSLYVYELSRDLDTNVTCSLLVI